MHDFYCIPNALLPEFEALLVLLALPPAVVWKRISRVPGCTRYTPGPLTTAQDVRLREAAGLSA